MPFDFQPVQAQEIVNQALDALETKWNDNDVSLELVLPEDLPHMRADVSTLCIAVMNLLDNAYKYSGKDKRIRVEGAQVGQNVHLSVSDNGVGLSAAERERVRERFYRVDESKGGALSGSGLGLSIVSDIVSAHRGDLLIESLPGQGSVFTLVIPVS